MGITTINAWHLCFLFEVKFMTLFDFFPTWKQKDEEEASFLLSSLQLGHEIYVQHILCLLVSSSRLHHFVDGNFTAFLKRGSLSCSHSSNEILISQTNRFIANNWLTLPAGTLKLFFHPPFALIRRASIETQINRLMKIKSADVGRNKEDEWIMERRKKLRSSEGLLWIDVINISLSGERLVAC